MEFYIYNMTCTLCTFIYVFKYFYNKNSFVICELQFMPYGRRSTIKINVSDINFDETNLENNIINTYGLYKCDLTNFIFTTHRLVISTPKFIYI